MSVGFAGMCICNWHAGGSRCPSLIMWKLVSNKSGRSIDRAVQSFGESNWTCSKCPIKYSKQRCACTNESASISVTCNGSISVAIAPDSWSHVAANALSIERRRCSNDVLWLFGQDETEYSHMLGAKQMAKLWAFIWFASQLPANDAKKRKKTNKRSRWVSLMQFKMCTGSEASWPVAFNRMNVWIKLCGMSAWGFSSRSHPLTRSARSNTQHSSSVIVKLLHKMADPRFDCSAAVERDSGMSGCVGLSTHFLLVRLQFTFWSLPYTCSNRCFIAFTLDRTPDLRNTPTQSIP